MNIKIGVGIINRKLLFNKNFNLIFLCDFLSNVSDAFCSFVINWHIITVTKSSLYLSLFSVFNIIPVLFCFPLGGALADKFSRKKIVVWSDFIRGCAYFGCAVLLFTNSKSVWPFYFLSFVLGICVGFYSPAMTAMVPNAVSEEHLVKANSLFSIDSGISMVIGVLLGGLSASADKVEIIIIAAGMVYIICFILEGFLDGNLQTFQEREKSAAENDFFSQIRQGAGYLKSQIALWTIFTFFLVVNFITSPLSTIYLPYLFNQVFKAKAIQLSFVQISYGAGYILLACVSTTMLKKSDSVKSIFRGILIEGIAILAIGFAVIPHLVMPNTKLFNIICIIFIAVALGCGVSLVNINVNSYFQSGVEDRYRGRVTGLINVMLKIATPLGYLLGGVVANKIPLFVIFMATGALLIIFTVFVSNKKCFPKIGLQE